MRDARSASGGKRQARPATARGTSSGLLGLLLGVFLGPHRLPAADCERVILDRFLDILALEPWHLRADLDRLVGLRDFDAGNDILCAVGSYSLREFVEQPVDLAMQAEQSEARRLQCVGLSLGASKVAALRTDHDPV